MVDYAGRDAGGNADQGGWYSMNPALQALVAITIGVGGCLGYFIGANRVLDWLVRRAARGADRDRALRAVRRATLLRPWLFLLPALIMGELYLVYPFFETLRLSLTERLASGDYFWAGADNYQQMLGAPDFREALRNTLLWMLVVPAAATTIGLIAAEVTRHGRTGRLARAMILLPLVLSLAGAATAWKMIYAYAPPGEVQTGLLNAVVTALGGQPRDWLADPMLGSFAMMAILIWAQTGLAMVIFAPALGAIPPAYTEAARVDGAGPVQVFLRIQVPLVRGTVMVVWTMLTLMAARIFDIVFALTDAQGPGQVLSTYMYHKLFHDGDWGVAAAAAMVMLALVTPILVWNVVQARRAME